MTESKYRIVEYENGRFEIETEKTLNGVRYWSSLFSTSFKSLKAADQALKEHIEYRTIKRIHEI